ncbi:MAG: DOMON domain-containing protein [Trueperaceae bacterium]
MIKKLLVTALALALVGTVALAQPAIDGAIADGEYANILEHDSGAVLYWTIDGDTLYMGYTMEARGWSGVGWLSEQSNRKAGADELMFAIVDGEAVAYDAYQSGARGAPELDEDEGGSNSLSAFAAVHEDDVWTVEFSRHLATGEETDVDIVPGEPMIFMLAHGNTMDIERAHERSNRGGAFYIEDFVF